MSWFLLGSFSCALVPIVGLGFISRLVSWIDPDWSNSARKRGQWLAKHDLVASLDADPQWPAFVTMWLACVYLSHYGYGAVFFILSLACYGVQQAGLFALRFAIANLLYLGCQIVLPVSPPWRFRPEFGNKPEAGMGRFDALVGRTVCQTLYRKSHWYDGAFPSGHVLWPCLVAMHALDVGWGWWSAYLLLHLFLVALAAMHFCHHFAVDCFAAVGIAAITISIL